MNLENTYRDRVAIVIGGASGIGHALSQRLVALGASVILADIDDVALQTVAGSLMSSAQHSQSVRGKLVDATDSENVHLFFDELAKEDTAPDFLFNSVGQGYWGDVREATESQWREVFAKNFWSAVHPSIEFIKRNSLRNSGHIVNIASMAGLVPIPTTIPYTSAKHAVVGFSLSLREEVASLGIRVSVVCPGPVKGAFHSRILIAGKDTQARREPQGSIAPSDAAEQILLGVSKNHATIAFPSALRWRWRLSQWIPQIFRGPAQKAVARMRSQNGS